ncbi:uncharacterized protein TNCV_3326201 [Trichonephila clavipes]|nr:uncharacterized protein TNCV_3326201 [Trichonephila clavipes]
MSQSSYRNWVTRGFHFKCARFLAVPHILEVEVSLVVRASYSRPEGLGSMPDATKYPPKYVLVKSVNSKSCGLSHEHRVWRVFPSTSDPCRNCGGGEIGGVAIYCPFGESRRAKSYFHLYGAQGKRQAYF